MKYLCLAYEDERAIDALSRAEWAELRRETLECVEQWRESGRLLSAQALQSVHTATTVRVRDGRLSTTDGPFAETKETLGGVLLIEAADLDEAIALAARWPSARIGSIEVRPVEESLRPEGRYRDAAGDA